jgi:DNA-binding MarR family transcriptional regulator
LKLLELLKVIIHISNTFSDETPKLKTPNILNLPSFETIYEAFNRIYFYHFKSETSFLQTYELDLDLTELKLLTLSYIFEEEGFNQPSSLNEKTSMQFSTISSIIHKLDKEGFIYREVGKVDKRKLDIILKPHTIKIVEDYMSFRIDTYGKMKQAVTQKQFDLIEQTYQFIKKYTEIYKKKARS